MFDWLGDNKVLMYCLTAASVVMFVVSLVATGILIVRLPADYFAHGKRPPRAPGHARRGVLVKVGRNILGAVLVLTGLVMLALPGQGVLTVLVGIMLLDVPGKYRLEKWIVSRGKVLRGMNWLRGKWKKEPLRLQEAGRRGKTAIAGQ